MPRRRKRGQLPLAETDLEDNDAIPEKRSPVSDSEPALEALRDVYANLVERLHSPSVIEHLYSGRLLTKVEYDLAKSKESNYDKRTEVLGALMRRGTAEVVKFCQVLFEQNQHNCGSLLLDALSRRGVDVSSVVIPSQTPPVVRSTSPKYYIEMEDLDHAFITLVREVKKVGTSLDPEDLRTICIELLNGVSSTKRNVQEDIDALRRCDGDYIGYLQPYWDSLDCNLLHKLIRQLNKPELIGDWEKYRIQVKEACTATLEECRRSLPQGRELPPDQITIGFQTTQPPNDVTVQKMLDLKDFLIKRMGLTEADFAGFTNSDVTLFFTVSRSRLPFLVRMCALHRRSLQDFSSTVVFIPGEFIYDVNTDQEFSYLEATSQRTEPVFQIKDLKEEILRQFEQLQASKVNEDAKKNEHLQNEAIALKMKLKEEEMLRKKTEEEQRRIAGELVKMEKKWSESGSKSNTIPKKAISDVESLLGQSSESVEGLQDKIRILVEEWSKISEHEPEATSLSAGQLHQIEDLREEMVRQFEQLQTSQVLQKQIQTLKGTLCKDHLDTIEKAVEGYQKVAAFLEDSGLLEGKLSLSIDLCQLAVEKKSEVDSMLEVLQTKQKELQSDEHLYLMLKGKKHKAIPKGEIATPKTASKKENWDTASEKENSDTDIDLISSASEEVPQERPEQPHEVWKEEEDVPSLHHALDKLTPLYATVLQEFDCQVERVSKYDRLDKPRRVSRSILLLSKAALAKRKGVNTLPFVSGICNDFIDNILDNTTTFDIEMITIIANDMKEPTLTEAVEKYEAALKPLMKASISELTEKVYQDSSAGTYKLVLKFPGNHLVQDLYNARYYLEKYLNIPEAKLLVLPGGNRKSK